MKQLLQIALNLLSFAGLLKKNLHNNTAIDKTLWRFSTVCIASAKPFSNILNKATTILVVVFLFLGCVGRSVGQTTLAAGDIAILEFKATNLDQFSFILLKDIATSTVINFTDNGFTAGTTGRTGEGFLVFTAQSAYTAGTIFTWTNGSTVAADWSSNAPSNFSFNASGDQLFAFQGLTTNWAS